MTINDFKKLITAGAKACEPYGINGFLAFLFVVMFVSAALLGYPWLAGAVLLAIVVMVGLLGHVKVRSEEQETARHAASMSSPYREAVEARYRQADVNPPHGGVSLRNPHTTGTDPPLIGFDHDPKPIAPVNRKPTKPAKQPAPPKKRRPTTEREP